MVGVGGYQGRHPALKDHELMDFAKQVRSGLLRA